MAVGFWNFFGAGVLGFLINLPIVSYFEMGTLLTPNHGHAAMFGVFGMLALSVLIYSVRSMQSDRVWAQTERYVRVSFWGLNVGLALMLILNLFPAGVLQLLDVIENGYYHARQPEFLFTGWFHKLEWLRIIGDTTFIVLGVLPIAWATIRSFIKRDVAPGERISAPPLPAEIVRSEA
jgi:nitric oxide reductase subunit B